MAASIQGSNMNNSFLFVMRVAAIASIMAGVIVWWQPMPVITQSLICFILAAMFMLVWVHYK